MSFYRDKHIRNYIAFLSVLVISTLIVGLFFAHNQINNAKTIYLVNNEALASSLLEQGVDEKTIVTALTNWNVTQQGQKLVSAAGISQETENNLLPFILQFQKTTISYMLITGICIASILFLGTFYFLGQRKTLYEQTERVLKDYIDGDYSGILPQNGEGSIFQIFALIEQLAKMLQAKNETEHATKEFLKNTISDISHRLKTPLAALTMYQEIIESEPDNIDTVKEFAKKIGISLKRMEQLIQSMLKITRLDTGNIVFEKSNHNIKEVLLQSINDLTTRAKNENKHFVFEGDPNLSIFCDIDWTSEAIGNIIKNALDHTTVGGTIHVSWERTPLIFRLSIMDNGTGIAPEDIHHIFKRFYRSKYSLDTQGVGLGLSLAKAIIEGQAGTIAVQSELNKGTTFTISLLTEL